MYRLLLRLLPRGLREDFGRDMEQLYRDRLAEAAGSSARLRVHIESWLDVVWQSVVTHGEDAREAWTTTMTGGGGMDGWLQDLRFGLRTLTRRPGFTLTAVATLGLGIGATVSIFSVVHTVLLSPLPFPDSDRLVVLWSEDRLTGERSRGIDHPDVRRLQEDVPGLSLAGFSGTRPTLTGEGDPQVVFGAVVTDGLVDLMGYEPILGRDLSAADDVGGGPQVLVVSHEFWVERLGADPDVLGRTIVLSGGTWEIIGVGPEGFDWPNGAEFWLPRRQGDDGCDHGCRILNVVGRLDPGLPFEAAQSRISASAAGLAEAFPDVHRDDDFALQSMLDYEVAGVERALWVLMGAVGLVLLIACANVANLFLVRASGRVHEVLLRATLGASRGRIVRQLLTESLLVATASTALGLGLANVGVTLLHRLAPADLPRLDTLALDGTAVLFSVVLSIVVAALFGVVPALHASRRVSGDSRSGRRTTGDRQTEASRSFLLGAEVALSLTLLLGAGLLIRTLGEMRSVELGFDTEGIERFRVSVPEARYDSIAVGEFVARMESELSTIPGVVAAGWGFGVPMASGSVSTSTRFSDRATPPPPDQPSISFRPSTEGLIDAMGTRLVRGRWFTAEDRYGAPYVAVVNQALVDEHFDGRDPIGVDVTSDVTWAFGSSPPRTIVGVVENVVTRSPTEEIEPAVYAPNRQFGANTGYFHLRLEPGVATAIPDARRVVAELDPSLAIWGVTTIEDVVTEASTDTLFYAALLSVFSVVALLLAAVGLYGVVAYTVSQRTREIGVRIALGADGEAVTRLVARRGIGPAVVGVLAGLGLSWLSARALNSLLYEVTWQDPATLFGVSALMIAVFGVASAVPARRAARVPPSSALRAE